MMCPECSGATNMPALIDGRRYGYLIEHPCSLCRGTGEVTITAAAWWREGAAHRNARVAARVSIIQRAAQIGVSSLHLAAMEGGRSDPSMLASHERERGQ